MPEAHEGPSQRLEAVKTVLVTALVASVLAAMGQLAYQGFNLATGRRFIFASRDMFWMAPLAYAAFMGLVGAPLTVAALIIPSFVRPHVVAFTFAFVTAFVLLLRFSGLAIWATCVLAAGLAVQAALFARRDGRAWRRRMLRVTAAGLGALALIGVVARAWDYTTSRRAVASLPSAPADAPNVLLVVLDAVRASRMSTYGYARHTTPAITRLASEGMLFERAISTAPWTLPSHASMFTGRYPTRLSTDFRHRLDDTEQTLAERLARRGYVSGGFVANEYYTTWETGLARGFNRWVDFQRTWSQTLLSAWPWQTPKLMQLRSARSWQDVKVAIRYAGIRIPGTLEFDAKHSDRVVRDFLDWHAALPADRPFFAVLNMFDGHRPWYSPPEFRARFTPAPRGPDRYDNAIAFMDAELQRVLDTLDARGALGRTAVVVTSDHGELLGEHDLFGHSSNVYIETLWVPLVLWYPPRVNAGALVAQPVSLRDLAATIADFTGLPPDDRPPGHSLLGLAGAAGQNASVSPAFSFAHLLINQEPHFPSSRGAIRSLVTRRHHYILHHDGGEELFDLEADPGELSNLAGSAEAATVRRSLRRLVDSLAPVGHERAFPYAPRRPRRAP